MSRKNFKKMVAPMASVLALGIGASLGIDNVTEMKDAFIMIGTGIGTLISISGVWANNDK